MRDVAKKKDGLQMSSVFMHNYQESVRPISVFNFNAFEQHKKLSPSDVLLRLKPHIPPSWNMTMPTPLVGNRISVLND